MPVVRETYTKLREKRLELAALMAMGMLYFFSYFHRVAVPGTMFNEIQTDLAISAAAVTALGSVFLYVYAGAQLFVGIAADRLGGMRVLLLGGLIMTVGSIVFPLSGNVWLLYGSRALLGLGASAMYLSIVKEIDALFGPKNFAALLGILVFMGGCGAVVGTLPCERAVAASDWRTVLLGAGLLSAVALLCVSLLVRRFKHAAQAKAAFAFGPVIDAVRNLRSLPVVVCGSTNWALYFLIQATLGKKFLEDVIQLSSAAAASCTFTMMIVSTICVLLSGFLVRAMGNRRKPLVVGTTAMTVAAAGLLLYGTEYPLPVWGFVVSYVLFAASSGFAPVFVASMKELNSAETVAISVAVLNTACYLAVAVVVNVAGIVLDQFQGRALVTPMATIYPAEAYGTIFGGVLVVAALSFAVSFFAQETRGEPVGEEAKSGGQR